MGRRKGYTLIVSGPSGAGKSSLCREILARDAGVGMCVTTTTRPPRPDEVEGRDRFFVDEASFREGVSRGTFAEWASVHGYLYGTTWEALSRAQLDHDVVILDVDVQGAAHWKRQLGESSVTVFVAPPSLAVLKQRLIDRGANEPEDLARRLRNAGEELAQAGTFDYLIVNDRFEESLARLRAVMEAERCRTFRHDPGVMAEIVR